jgi:hypothetical protein
LYSDYVLIVVGFVRRIFGVRLDWRFGRSDRSGGLLESLGLAIVDDERAGGRVL